MNKKTPDSRELIEELHAEIPSSKINNLKKEINQGEHDFESETAELKTEINALTAYFIEDIWSQTTENIKARPPGLSATTKEELEKVPSTHFFSEAETAVICLRPGKSSEESLEFLKKHSENFVLVTLNNWSNDMEQAQNEMVADGREADQKDIKSKAYLRFKNLLQISSGKKYTREKFSPREHIARGIGTAVYTIWETIGILATVYKNQFNKAMPKDEFIKIAKNSLPLIYAIASSHLRIFFRLQDNYRLDEDSKRLLKEAFYFSGEADNLKLQLKASLIRAAEIPEGVQDPRTGCPAIFSTGPKHKNVIAEMSDWFIDLAEKYYLPKLEKEGLVAA
jgi:hypothetical protein